MTNFNLSPLPPMVQPEALVSMTVKRYVPEDRHTQPELEGGEFYEIVITDNRAKPGYGFHLLFLSSYEMRAAANGLLEALNSIQIPTEASEVVA